MSHRGWGYKQGGPRGHGRYFHGNRRSEDGNQDESYLSGSGSGGRGSARGGGGRGRGGRGRHPPGLKGKDIGLWYAKMSKENNVQRQIAERPKVEMDDHREDRIAKLLEDIAMEKTSDRGEPGQASGSAAPSETDVLIKRYYSKQLTKNETIDSNLKEDLELKRLNNVRYREMREFRKKLPSHKMQKELLELIDANQVTVISGETGCGKTTQVAQFILDHYIDNNNGSLCRVVCTQPRRISAVSVAERVADERGETVGDGQSVGYQIRLENKLPRNQGSILYCTTGILLKWLQGDPMLKGLSHIILDEVHERNIVSDFLIIILRDLLPQRPDLKLILMSATLNADKFSSYYGNCPMVTIPGFTFPVTEYWIEDVLQLTSYRTVPSPWKKRKEPHYWKFMKGKRKRDDEIKKEEEYNKRYEEYIQSMKDSYSEEIVESIENLDEEEINFNLIVELIRHIVLNGQDGAILVFVPGWTDISKLNDMLQKSTMFNSDRFIIIPLHSLMPTANQRQVFDRPPAGVRKIVIATNIAETSITIDDVVHVINTGKSKESNYDVENNISTLKPEWVSKAAAQQRRGRAGRVQPGYCYHLYTQLRADLMVDYQLPEMLRTLLEEVCLQIRLLKLGYIEDFIGKALDQPSPEAVKLAMDSLKQLNALNDDETLTPLGYHLAKLPVEPRIGKMILFGAMFCCLNPVLTIAASLSFKDPFIVPLGKEEVADQCRKTLSNETKSDHLMLINAFQGWQDAMKYGWQAARNYCWENFLSMNTLKMLEGMKSQFCEYLCDIGFVHNADCKQFAANKNADNLELIKAVVCAGLYPNVAQIQKKSFKRPPILYTKQDGKVKLHPKSVNAGVNDLNGKWLVYHQKIKSSGVFLHDSSVMQPYPLLFFGGNISIGTDHEQDVVKVDDWIIFQSPPRIAGLVKKLKQELDELLEHKITNPGVTKWNRGCREGKIMTAIVDLLTMEDKQQYEADYQDDRGQSSSGHRSRHWRDY